MLVLGFRKKFPQYGDFKVAENILSLVNNQGMVWMGMFFSPGLVVFNVIKLYIMMYFRAWAVLTCNAPPEVIFRASRSNNFYYALLLMMLFLCVLPVGYAIVWIKPSWHCGPFSQYQKIFHIFTKSIKNNVPPPVQHALDYIASPGIVIPLLVLLILIIYYLVSLTGALRGANEELKIQLKRERTEERRKMFQMADRRRRGGSGESNELSNTPFNKWKKLIGNLPSGKSLDETPKQETDEIPPPVKEEKPENRNKDFFSKLIKKALGKSSTSEEEPNGDDGTDTEQHDSLPDDPQPNHKPARQSFSWGSNEFQNVASKALLMKKKQQQLDNLSKDTPEDAIDKRHVHIKDSSSKKLRKDSIEKNETSRISQERISNLPQEVDGTLDKKRNKKLRKDGAEKNDAALSRKSQDRIASLPEEVDEIQDTTKYVHIIKDKYNAKKPLRRRDSIFEKNESSTPKINRQDSETSSIWSDNIPVITISKTESAENILNNIETTNPTQETPTTAISKGATETAVSSFKPKIRCALKKQSAEIDEDTICYFHEDLEKNKNERKIIAAIVERSFDEDSNYKYGDEEDDEIVEAYSDFRECLDATKNEEALTDKSSSEETEYKDNSVDTVLNVPLGDSES